MSEYKNYWCIVTYEASYLYYYCGYFQKERPVVSASFYDSLKLDSERDALKIMRWLPEDNWKVELHSIGPDRTL